MFKDHREVGKNLDLFHIQEEAVGSIFWHENGWFLYNKIKNYMRSIQRRYHYKEVNSPQMLRKGLWEQSGHWDNYKQNMFCVSSVNENNNIDNLDYALKPMNCACHIQIYNRKIVSYKELPIRYSEFGQCMRNEPSGSLSGLMRVRSFVQDDAHIFCMEEQIQSELQSFFKMAHEVYNHFGFKDIKIVLSGRPELSAGNDEQWEQAENVLKEACEIAGYDYDYDNSGGAFYAPKLELKIKDHMDREWQCGTVQIDYILPQRLDAKYIDSHGKIKHPVILHRAILGSFERFIGILLENHGENLPNWLHPRCLAIVDISENGFDESIIPLDYEQYVICKSKKDLRALIKKYSEEKYKFLLVYGRKEEESNSLPINVLGKDKIFVSIDELKKLLC